MSRERYVDWRCFFAFVHLHSPGGSCCFAVCVCDLQFILPHNRGSSHGHSRITRMAYNQPFYSDMMTESFRIWQQLEHDAGLRLYM